MPRIHRRGLSVALLLAFALALPQVSLSQTKAREARAAAKPAPASTRAAPKTTASDDSAAMRADPDTAFVNARRAFAAGDIPAFERAAAHAASHDLADYLDFWRLRLQVRRGLPDAGTGNADAGIREFLAAFPGTQLGEQLRRDWLIDLARRGDWNAFERQYEHWDAPPDRYLTCWAQSGRTERGQPVAGDPMAATYAVDDLGEGCSELMASLLRARRIGAVDIRRRLLAGLEANSRDTVERSAALLGLEAGSVASAWTRPVPAFSANGPAEISLIALARGARADPAWAAARLEEGVPGWSKDQTAYAWALVAAAAMRDLLPQSLAWTRHALKQKPGSMRPGDATLEWMARAALREHDWKTLTAALARMSEEGRRDPTWVYWQARALAMTDQLDGARALWRTIADDFHFYGQLAAEDLGQPLRVPTPAAAASDAEIHAAGRKRGLQRAMRLYALGLRAEGNREWNFELRDMSDRQLLAAATWACRNGVLDRCVNTADRTRAEHDFSLRFIAPFVEQLKPVAANRGLDPAWIYGLIRQESRFLMDARSSAGAQGLMQIMPATGRWIAGKLGVRDFRVAQLNHLSVNLEFGTFYLRTVLDDLDGSPVLASAGYNAGPRRPQRWRASLPAPVEGAIFAEIIPFAETRDYVKKVLSNSVIYAERFRGGPQSLRTWLGQIAPPSSAPAEVAPLAAGPVAAAADAP